jgi:hypothetical protein
MSGKEGDVARHGRRDRLIKERGHDPYMTRSKLTEPTACSECRVVFSNGRWRWLPEVLEGVCQELCPACQRTRDRVPAGFLTLKGEFFVEHRDEIMHLLHNKVEAQKAQHPSYGCRGPGRRHCHCLHRCVPACGAGEAIQRAYEGDLDIHYTDEAGIVRVY